MRPSPQPGHRGAGFSFIELLFAVAVMGIGFIMIAAVFPVGLQQTKLTLDETAGAAGSRGMAAKLQQAVQTAVTFQAAPPNTKALLPPTYVNRVGGGAVLGRRYSGQVRTLNDPRVFCDATPMVGDPAQMRRFNMWQAIANDLVNPADPRSATAVLFKRDMIGAANPATGAVEYMPEGTAQVLAINVLAGNTAEFTAKDVSSEAAPPTPLRPTRDIYSLEPRPVAVQIVYDTANQTYVASFFSVYDLDGGGAYDHGGYPPTNTPVNTPLNAPTSPNGNNWQNVLDAAVGAVGEGAFVVISDDRIVAPAGAAGRLNGISFRLGARRTDLAGSTYDLAPGYGFTPEGGADGFINTTAKPSADDLIGVGVDGMTTTTLSGLTYSNTPFGTGGANGTTVGVAGMSAKGAVALVVGRGFANPAVTPTAAGGYIGPVQDVSLYTTFVSVPTP